jgi:hypothetical protein
VSIEGTGGHDHRARTEIRDLPTMSVITAQTDDEVIVMP